MVKRHLTIRTDAEGARITACGLRSYADGRVVPGAGRHTVTYEVKAFLPYPERTACAKCLAAWRKLA